MGWFLTVRTIVPLVLLALGCELPVLLPTPASPRSHITRINLPPGVAVDSLGPDFPSIDDACETIAFASAGEVYTLGIGQHAFNHVSVSYTGGSANQRSGIPRISRDGSRLAFDSAASNLVPGGQNRHDQVFLATLGTGEILRVSQATDGAQANNANIAYDGTIAMSRDGRFVVFSSYASNLVQQDSNGKVDVFLHDVERRTTVRVSESADGREGDGNSVQPSISSDGITIAFASEATNLVADDQNGVKDVFVHDRARGTTERVTRGWTGSEANGASDFAAVDGSGRFVAFASSATNLVPEDRNGVRDVFLFDTYAGRTDRISASDSGEGGDADSDTPVIDANGSRVAFVSRASNLVAGDRNEVADIFLYDRPRKSLVRLTMSPDRDEANDESGAWGIDISGNGRCVVFGSFASNLVGGDDNQRTDLFLARIR
jgi:Tol biopolymer transport system component